MCVRMSVYMCVCMYVSVRFQVAYLCVRAAYTWVPCMQACTDIWTYVCMYECDFSMGQMLREKTWIYSERRFDQWLREKFLYAPYFLNENAFMAKKNSVCGQCEVLLCWVLFSIQALLHVHVYIYILVTVAGSLWKSWYAALESFSRQVTPKPRGVTPKSRKVAPHFTQRMNTEVAPHLTQRMNTEHAGSLICVTFHTVAAERHLT